MSSQSFAARRDALDYIETNPDDHASRMLAALLSELDAKPTYQAAYERERELLIEETKRTSALTQAIRRIGLLHKTEVMHRHHPIAWWRERFGDEWVSACTKPRRELDEATRDAVLLVGEGE